MFSHLDILSTHQHFVAPGRRKTLAVARMGCLVLVLHLHVQSQAGQMLPGVLVSDLLHPWRHCMRTCSLRRRSPVRPATQDTLPTGCSLGMCDPSSSFILRFPSCHPADHCSLQSLQGGLNLQRMHKWDPQTWHCTVWQVDNPAGTFIAHHETRKPPDSAALTLNL